MSTADLHVDMMNNSNNNIFYMMYSALVLAVGITVIPYFMRL